MTAQQAVQLPELPTADAHAQARARAREAVPAESQHRYTVSPPREATLRRARALDKALREGALLHARPASMHAARTCHHQAAARWNGALPKYGRLGWAYLVHLPARAVLFGVDWALGTFPRFVMTAAVFAALWFWH